MADFERTPEFEKKVANQETSTSKTKELDLMTDDEFNKVIPVTGPAKPEEAELLRNGVGPAREINKK